MSKLTILAFFFQKDQKKKKDTKNTKNTKNTNSQNSTSSALVQSLGHPDTLPSHPIPSSPPKHQEKPTQPNPTHPSAHLPTYPTSACFPGPGCGPSKCASSTAPTPPFTAAIA